MAKAKMRKPMTQSEFDKSIVESNVSTVDALVILHRLGLTTLYVESVVVGKESYYSRIVISQKEMSWDQLDELHSTCENMGWKLLLNDSFDFDGQRLIVWVS